MLRAVIIDDEQVHRDVLKRNLSVYCKDIKVVGEFGSGTESLDGLPKLTFDLLFMDIELGDMNSFELLQQLPFTDLHIIFITSFDKYALQAFKVHAVDYLIKPVDGAGLQKSIEMAMSQIIGKDRRMGLISDYSFQKNNKLLLSDSVEYELIGIETITYCKSDGNYTNIFHLDIKGNEIRFTDTHNLKYFEDKLSNYGFIRIHQSYLVNKDHVYKVRKNPFEVVLVNGSSLPVARERKHVVFDFFESLQ
jgi:two-component system, LytTR family, response regulator